MSALYVIICNGCGAAGSYQSTKGLAHARKVCGDRGWTHPMAGQDFCMTCSAGRKAAREEREAKEGFRGYL